MELPVSIMPTDTAAIAGFVNVINASVAPLLAGSPLPEEQRAALALAAEKLAIAAREPEENVYYIATQVISPAHTTSVCKACV